MDLPEYNFPVKHSMINDSMVETLSQGSMINEREKRILNISVNQVDSVVHTVLTKLHLLGNERARRWFCYVAWRLPESTIMTKLELALEKARNPAAYFTTLLKQELRAVGW